MMPTPFVSIILPVRNEAAHIGRCLESVLALDLGGIEQEVLVVDGMSEDATLKTISEYEGRISQLRLLTNPAKGVAAGRNIGIKAARGDVVVLMDAHARYAPDYVKRCLEVMEKTGAANVGGPAVALPGGDTTLARAIALAHHSPFGLGGGQFRDPGAEGFVETVWPGCYRREVFGKAGYIDERRSRTEDLEFNTRVRAAGFTIYLSPAIKAWYYCRTTLGETWRQRWADGFEITRFLPDNPSAPKPRHYIPLVFVFSLLCSGGAALFLPATMNLQHLGLVMFWSIVVAYFSASLFFTTKVALGLHVHKVHEDEQPAGSGLEHSNMELGIPRVHQGHQDESSVDTGPDHSNLELSNLEHGVGSIALMPIVFATLHLSYGLGSIWGLVSLPFVSFKLKVRGS